MQSIAIHVKYTKVTIYIARYMSTIQWLQGGAQQIEEDNNYMVHVYTIKKAKGQENSTISVIQWIFIHVLVVWCMCELDTRRHIRANTRRSRALWVM